MADSYKIRDVGNLILQHLDYMSLLYDRQSGITHIIAEPAPQIIEALGQDVMKAAQIEQILIKQYDVQMFEDESSDSFEDIIIARLDEFVDLGLAEKIISI